MDEEELKILELNIKDLISQRQLVVSALIVLIGGVCGALLLPNIALKFALITVGVYFAIVLIRDFYNINANIRKYLRKK